MALIDSPMEVAAAVGVEVPDLRFWILANIARMGRRTAKTHKTTSNQHQSRISLRSLEPTSTKKQHQPVNIDDDEFVLCKLLYIALNISVVPIKDP